MAIYSPAGFLLFLHLFKNFGLITHENLDEKRYKCTRVTIQKHSSLAVFQIFSKSSLGSVNKILNLPEMLVSD